MGRVDVERDYFVLIYEKRDSEREAAFERLKATNDENIMKLADLGQEINMVIRGEDPPSALKKVLDKFGNFTLDSFWNRLKEVTGQTILAKGFSMPEDEEGKGEMLRQGLLFLYAALNGGIPISDYSLKLVRKAKETDKKLARLAQSVITRNDQLKPELKLRMRPPTGKPGPEKPAGKEGKRA